ncbi:hypothetical protein CDD82_4793 [Ophiocordyceps australis]|uniref:SRP54-type proteins GTP-binding domain-containing protein n=1 Tax=Ophiocordyceps australis TaxID=1399860 RepID=A0A2C5Z4H8_9HYPO|nr:hypothetical protein CDD82_4793 [Ophiocordyceps australis]
MQKPPSSYSHQGNFSPHPPMVMSDKIETLPLCLDFILHRLGALEAAGQSQPLVVGVNGVQGVGKTTLVTRLAEQLEQREIPAVVCSIDDFYLTHTDQVKLARENPDNALLQHRGQPGTHDLALARSVLSALWHEKPTRLPRYDKSAFHGQGDRLPESAWIPVNQPGTPSARVILLEGWCIGFHPLTPQHIAARYASPSRTLQSHSLSHLLLINDKLHAYDFLINLFDAFIHIDTNDVANVYSWRQQQEESLRAQTGNPHAGMTREQVVCFVDAYYPAYELYTHGLRAGLFTDCPDCHLRIVLDSERSVKTVEYVHGSDA